VVTALVFAVEAVLVLIYGAALRWRCDKARRLS
jgi:hypothetical protein